MPSEPSIGYEFSQADLLEAALTHPSFESASGHNQRLEFLGDAVLGLVVAEQLYRLHPEAPEGELDRMRAGLVNGRVLAAQARSLGIDRRLRVGEAQRRHLPEPSDGMLEDALEALIGAIHLDGGLEAARAWVLKQFGAAIAAAHTEARSLNPKGRLQEWAQARDPSKMPDYRLITADGPDHAKFYTVELSLAGRPLATGTGSSKQLAEVAAAEAALAAIDSDKAR